MKFLVILCELQLPESLTKVRLKFLHVISLSYGIVCLLRKFWFYYLTLLPSCLLRLLSFQSCEFSAHPTLFWGIWYLLLLLQHPRNSRDFLTSTLWELLHSDKLQFLRIISCLQEHFSWLPAILCYFVSLFLNMLLGFSSMRSWDRCFLGWRSTEDLSDAENLTNSQRLKAFKLLWSNP